MRASPDSAFIYTSAGISGVGWGSAMKRRTFMQAGGEEATCPTNSQKATRESQSSNPDTLKKLTHVCICLNSNRMIHAGTGFSRASDFMSSV